MSEVIRVPTGPISRQAVPDNDASTDPGGAGEFLQTKRDEGEYFRYFGYDNVLQQGGEGYPSTYRENFGNPTAISILVNARAMRLHLNDVQGYNPVQLKNYVSYLNELNGAVQNYHDAQILPGGLNSPPFSPAWSGNWDRQPAPVPDADSARPGWLRELPAPGTLQTAHVRLQI